MHTLAHTVNEREREAKESPGFLFMSATIVAVEGGSRRHALLPTSKFLIRNPAGIEDATHGSKSRTTGEDSSDRTHAPDCCYEGEAVWHETRYASSRLSHQLLLPRLPSLS